jgi:hypothetical protein
LANQSRHALTCEWPEHVKSERLKGNQERQKDIENAAEDKAFHQSLTHSNIRNISMRPMMAARIPSGTTWSREGRPTGEPEGRKEGLRAFRDEVKLQQEGRKKMKSGRLNIELLGSIEDSSFILQELEFV